MFYQVSFIYLYSLSIVLTKLNIKLCWLTYFKLLIQVHIYQTDAQKSAKFKPSFRIFICFERLIFTPFANKIFIKFQVFPLRFSIMIQNFKKIDWIVRVLEKWTENVNVTSNRVLSYPISFTDTGTIRVPNFVKIGLPISA